MTGVREFWLLQRPTFPGTAAAYAIIHSSLMLYGGIGHIVAVTGPAFTLNAAYTVFIAAGWIYHRRAAT